MFRYLAGTRIVLSLSLSLSLLAPAIVQAETWSNTGTSSWFTSTNWSPQNVPGSGTAAYVNNGGTTTVATGQAVCYLLWLGETGNDTGYLEITGGSYSGTYGGVGGAGLGGFTHTAGSVWVGSLYVANSWTGEGTYTLDPAQGASPSLSVNSAFCLGHQGVGTFVQNGGTASVGGSGHTSFNLGTWKAQANDPDPTAKGEGTYELNGGSATAAYTTLGDEGKGTLVQTGGEFTSGTIEMGYRGDTSNWGTGNEKHCEGEGIYELQGGSVEVGGVLVGGTVAGKGDFKITGGTATIGGMQVGCYSLAWPKPGEDGYTVGTGIVRQEGGTLTVTGQCDLGGFGYPYVIAGDGTMEITGGNTNIGSLNIGCYSWTAPDDSVHGSGLLQVGDEDVQAGTQAEIVITGSGLTFGNRAAYTVVAPEGQQSSCSFLLTGASAEVVNRAVVVKDEYGQPISTNLPGLLSTSLVFKGQDYQGSTKKIELAGKAVEDVGDLTVEDFGEVNFALGELVVGDPEGGSTFGPVTLELKDDYDNQDDEGPQALYVSKLTLTRGGTFHTVGSVLVEELYYVHFPGEEGTQTPKKLYMGDANFDGEVGFADYQIWEAHFLYGPGLKWQDGDFDGDRDATYDDYLIIEANWGSGQRGDGPARALPVVKDYDDDGDVDRDDIRLMHELEEEQSNAGAAITKEISHAGDGSNSRGVVGFLCLFGVCCGVRLRPARRHRLGA